MTSTASGAQPKSPRLVFSELTPENSRDFHELACDEHIRRFLLDGRIVPPEWCADVLRNTRAEKAKTGLGMWLLANPDGHAPFGFAGYLRFGGPDAPPQLLFALRASHTGRGLAREATVALIDFAREHCARRDIVAGVDEPNVASRAVLTDLGFRCTGSVPGAFGRMLQYSLGRGCAPRERRTQRLRLRPFRAADSDTFAQLNADPRVMQHFPNPLTRAESDNALTRLQQTFEERGFGPWALELPSTGCVGAVGLSVPSFKSHFTPCVEVAWRLAYDHWGQGYAREAAREALYTAFVHLELEQVVAFTTPRNQRSRQVMQALGMQHDPNEDFDHPNLPAGHSLQRHVLYRLDKARWRATDHQSTL